MSQQRKMLYLSEDITNSDPASLYETECCKKFIHKDPCAEDIITNNPGVDKDDILCPLCRKPGVLWIESTKTKRRVFQRSF